MGIGEDFKVLTDSLVVQDRGLIADRHALITRRLNLDFWGADDRTSHSLYSGSYGRGTATGLTSDIDMLFWLPPEFYSKYNSYLTNGQSGMLRDVRNSLLGTYPSTDVGADGQVVVVPFSDGMTFEVVPAFLNTDGSSFTFPHAGDGGRWRTCDPRPEIRAIRDMDEKCNGNLKNLCRMARAWDATWAVGMGGLLIDTLAHTFLKDWPYREKSHYYYDWMSRDFFDFLAGQSPSQGYWLAVGSNQQVYRRGDFEYKAKRCRNISVDAIDYYSKEQVWSGRSKWKEVYGLFAG
jgi:hypothetical protein